MKRMLAITISLVAVFGMVAMASAAEYKVNMCGASAQAGFWEASGAAVVQATYGCTSAVLDWESGNDKNMIIQASGCDVDGDATADTIYVRYLASNSTGGCEGYTCSSLTYVDPTTCTWGNGTCTGTETGDCQLGCSDVPCDSFNARTRGNDDGCHGTGSSSYRATGIDLTEDTETFQGVVVPFGFIVNNAVTHYVCDYSDVDTSLAGRTGTIDWAYNKDGWQCDPTLNNASDENLTCRGEFKCVDGYCQNGLGTTNACVDASDCQYADVVPSCVEEPLDNLSLLQVCHIFAGEVDNWRDFGPSYSDIPVTRCMRHAGSGTHQTFLDTIMSKCGGQTALTTTVMDETCHYKSSSDLSRDCVGDYAGGVGYVDADKVMFRSGFDTGYDKGGTGRTVAGAHQIKFNGTAPSRYDVASGKYIFFASQVCFMDAQGDCFSGTEAPEGLDDDILRAIQTTAANATYLDYANFDQRAYFWATQGEMLVEKADGYPNIFPTNSGVKPGTDDDRTDW